MLAKGYALRVNMSELSEERVFWVVTELEDFEGERGLTERGGGFGPRRERRGPVKIPFAQLRTRMRQFVADMGDLLVDVSMRNPTGLELDEVELSVEIGGKGEILLLGKAEGKGALTLKFKKARPE